MDVTFTNINGSPDHLTTPDTSHHDIQLDNLESGHAIKNNRSRMATGYMTRLRRILLEFLSTTTFQGLPHIANASRKKSYYRLIYWISLILIAIALMVWAIVSITLEFAEMNTTMQSRQAYGGRIPFPAVTICNQNLYRKSAISNATNITDDVMSFLTLVSGNSVLLDNFNFREYLNQSGNLFAEDSPFFYNNSGHQLQDMLLSCRFAGKVQDCSFTRRSSTSGNCYTFNSGNNGSILYTADPGYFFGLELILNGEEQEYFLADIDSVGFNVYIHDQDHFPYYGGVGSFSVSTGQLTQVVLNRINYKLLSLGSGGQCSNSISLKYFNSYSEISCRTECITDFVVSMCNCKAQFMPGPAKVCKLSDICWFTTLARFDGQGCDCPIGCDFTIYEKTLSYAKYPAGHLTNTLNNSLFLSENSVLPDFVINSTVDKDGTEIRYLNDNFTESFLQNNLAKLRIYYDSLLVTNNEEILDYTLFQFVADFGGHIGLFTGAGFLTLFEVIELCFPKSDDDDK